MTAPDDMGNGPVIRDHRRIDPVTGQVRRGKHAASQPAGTSGAGRSAGSGSGGRHGRTPDGQPRQQGQASRQPGQDESGKPEQTAAPGQRGSAAGTTEEPARQAQPDGPGTTTATAPPKADKADKADKAEAEETKAGKGGGKLEVALAERTADLQRLQAEYANYRKRVERDRVAVKEHAVASVLTELLPVLDAIGQARDHGELSGGFKSVADSLQATVAKLGLVTYGEKGEPFDPKVHEALTHMYSPDVAEDTCIDILQPGYRVGDRILRPARVAVAEPADEDTD
jgi:molecular chaperone GrpE